MGGRGRGRGGKGRKGKGTGGGIRGGKGRCQPSPKYFGLDPPLLVTRTSFTVFLR